MSIYNTTKINKLSAECGRGKTYATCKNIARNNKQKNHLVVQPSTQLLEQTHQDLKDNFNVEATLITGSGSVKKVIQHLKECDKKGEILLINWECWNKLPLFFVENMQKWWGIFIDEIPQIDEFYNFNLLKNRGLFTDYFDIEKSVNEVLSLVVADDEMNLEEIIDDKDSIYSGKVKKLFRKVASPFYDVFVNAEDLHKSDDKSTIYFITMLNPTLFKGATLLGANIETNMLTKWFENYHDVQFHDDVDICNGLLPAMDYTDRLEIQYFTDKSNSKYFKNRKMKNGMSFNEAMHQLVQIEFKDEKYIFANNNDVESDLELVDGVERIPVISKGFNNYQHIHNFAFLPALNRQPIHLMMLNQLGIDDECIKVSTGYEALYQDVMRTSLRDRNSTKVVKIIVVSEEEAMHLVSVFGSSQKVKQVSQLFEYKKYEPLTNRERKHITNFNNASKSLVSIGGVFDEYYKHEKGNKLTIGLKDNCPQNDVHHTLNNTPINQGSLLDFVTIHPYVDADSKIVNMSFMELKNHLKKSSKVVTDDKFSHPLINSSIFRHQGYNQRTNDNFFQSNMIILDFDDGDISIQDFEEIFHLNAVSGQKRSFIICNSFSACNGTPNKFRVFMPLSKPVTSIDDYQAIFDSVLSRLSYQGYTMGSMALDSSSYSPVQSYFMPCTNRDHKEYAYFKAHGFDSARTLKQRSLNVDSILRTALKPVESNVVIQVDFKKKQIDIDAKVADAKRKYLQVLKGEGKRNSAFFDVGISLANYLDFYEIEQILNELAGNDKKMQKRIQGVIKSITNYKKVA